MTRIGKNPMFVVRFADCFQPCSPPFDDLNHTCRRVFDDKNAHVWVTCLGSIHEGFFDMPEGEGPNCILCIMGQTR